MITVFAHGEKFKKETLANLDPTLFDYSFGKSSDLELYTLYFNELFNMRSRQVRLFDEYLSLKDRLRTRGSELHKRNEELQAAFFELEEKTVALKAAEGKLKDLSRTKDQILTKLSSFNKNDFILLKSTLTDYLAQNKGNPTGGGRLQPKVVDELQSILEEVSLLYKEERSITSKKVLLLDDDKKQQAVVKMALGGTGVDLQIAAEEEVAREKVIEQTYDIVCLSSSMLDMAVYIKEKQSSAKLLLMTEENTLNYVDKLESYEFLSNIVARNEDDRHFTIKNITTTVKKLITGDLYGLEKYLNWGVEIFEQPIVGSKERVKLVSEMEEYLTNSGINKRLRTRCLSVAEELLMNVIYDAPVTEAGEPKYDLQSRQIPVNLEPQEQGSFRYATDGILFAVSATDPFGRFQRQTIIDYLKSCYEGREGSINEALGKQGAGRGTFIIFELADLIVLNIHPFVKTEVIALFDLDSKRAKKRNRNTSFHYFSH